MIRLVELDEPGVGGADCECCGVHHSEDFVRVYGDEDGRLHRCPECDTKVRLYEGSGAGLDVRTPDPRHNPGRHGGAADD